MENEVKSEYLSRLIYEKEMLRKQPNENDFRIVEQLIEQEIYRIQNGGKLLFNDEAKRVDVFKQRPIRLSVKVMVPIQDHPKFNFVGKLLGPKGNSLKRLQDQTQTKMAILGRGSVRNKEKECQLRNSGDPKYAHLNDDLHVEICSYAFPAVAYARISNALILIRRFLVPDNDDGIIQEQLYELKQMEEKEDYVSKSDLMKRVGLLPHQDIVGKKIDNEASVESNVLHAPILSSFTLINPLQLDPSTNFFIENGQTVQSSPKILYRKVRSNYLVSPYTSSFQTAHLGK